MLRLTVAAALILVSLAGCGGSEEKPKADLAELKAGDCIAKDIKDENDRAPDLDSVVDYSEPHVFEIVELVDIPEEALTGTTDKEKLANRKDLATWPTGEEGEELSSQKGALPRVHRRGVRGPIRRPVRTRGCLGEGSRRQGCDRRAGPRSRVPSMDQRHAGKSWLEANGSSLSFRFGDVEPGPTKSPLLPGRSRRKPTRHCSRPWVRRTFRSSCGPLTRRARWPATWLETCSTSMPQACSTRSSSTDRSGSQRTSSSSSSPASARMPSHRWWAMTSIAQDHDRGLRRRAMGGRLLQDGRLRDRADTRPRTSLPVADLHRLQAIELVDKK